jgi:hypothetical protein
VQRLRAVPFPATLPTAVPKESDRPCDGSRRMRFAFALSTDPRRASTFRMTAPSGCPFPLPFRSVPRRVPTVRATGQGGCPSPLPFGSIPLRRRHRRRKAPRLPYPWRLRESEANSKSRVPRSSLCPPPAPPLRRGACAPHRLDIADGFGSGRERPSPRIGSHRMLRLASTLDSRLRDSRHTDTSASADRRKRRLELRRARSEPSHPRTRDAIRAARALDPTARVIDVAADGDPAPSLGGDHLRGSVQCGDSARRREASRCDVSTRHGATDSFRAAPPEGGAAWSGPTDRRARSSLRGPLAAHSAELLEGVATSSLPMPQIARHLTTPHLELRATPAARKPPLSSATPSEELTPLDHLAAA